MNAFNRGEFTACIAACERLREGHERDPWLFYMLARANYRRGDYAVAQGQVQQALELDPQNAAVLDLKKAIDQELQTVAQCPEIFRSALWCAGKTVVKVGGAIPLLEFHLSHARQIINIDAAETILGTRNAVDVLADAHDLPMLGDASVDAVVSSHTIEHLVNPLLALREWKRILRPGGTIYSCLPNYRETFDRKRRLTDLAHLVADLEGGRIDMDWFHAEEFLRNYDSSRDSVFLDDDKGHLAEYIKAPHLHTHFHVFDLALVYVMHQYLGFSTLACFEADFSIHYFGSRPEKSRQ